ncbi:hypothetical protein E1281_08420 [Actinomadura sp. KC345]|uniref:hypothetical protein n=1 Tax=Actinomadura sp. KC345 TaxID=2530371 RepID=UPI001046F44C|nr:hypothetical protein [Actinomadura sp. KC345]TDC56207.1 hypothetical protein E1281_08420 [Actinomadura sp. KC345]
MVVVGTVVFFGLAIMVGAMVVVTSAPHIVTPPPPRAGDQVRDRDAEFDDRLLPQLKFQRSIIKHATGGDNPGKHMAVYGNGSAKYMFVGGDGVDQIFDPDELPSRFRVSATSGLGDSGSIAGVIPLDDAGGSGKAVCATIRYRKPPRAGYETAICAWATRVTFGTIMPISGAGTSSQGRTFSHTAVASTMRQMRGDLED